MSTEEDIVRITSEQDIYEHTLESTVSKLERENRYLRGRVMDLERSLDNIKALVYAGTSQ